MISIIIPTRNRDKELVRAIQSAISQTGGLSLEVIVVDDSSSFDVKTYLGNALSSQCLSFIKVIRNEKCVGASASRNIGAYEARGKYLSFLDSDDFWCSNKLQKQIAKFIAEPELDVVYCDQFILNNGVLHESKKILIQDDIMDHLLAGWTAPNTSTLVIRKESFVRLGGFDVELQASEDHELWFRIAHHNLNVSFVNEPLSYFCQDSSVRLSYDLQKRVLGVIRFTERCSKYVSGENYKRFKRNNFFKVIYPIFVNRLKQKEFASAFYIFARYLVISKKFYNHMFWAVYQRLFTMNQV